MTVDEPRRTPSGSVPPRPPESDAAIRPDGYVVEPVTTDPTDAAWQGDDPDSGHQTGWPDRVEGPDRAERESGENGPDSRNGSDDTRLSGTIERPAQADEAAEPAGTEEPDDAADDDDEERARPRLRMRDRWRHLGLLAFILAAMLFATNIVGIILSTDEDSQAAALSIAYVTIFTTIITFLAGLIAALLDFGRVWGVGAVVLSVLANPFVLLVILGTFSGALG